MHNATNSPADADVGQKTTSHMLMWPKSRRGSGFVTFCSARRAEWGAILSDRGAEPKSSRTPPFIAPSFKAER